MTSRKTLLRLIGGCLLAIAACSSYSSFAQQNSNNVLDTRRQLIVNTARDIDRLNAALMTYWQENRAWPVSLNQLQTLGFIDAIPASARGEPYIGEAINASRQYRLTFSMVDNASAATVAGILPNGSVVGAVVSTIIDTPNSSNVYQDVLGRSLDPDFADRVVMKTDIDMAANNLNNVAGINGQSIDATTTNSTTVNAVNVVVGRAVVGSSSIQSSGSSLNVNSQLVDHSNNVSVGRNVNVSGALQAGSLTTNDLNAGGNIVSSSGNITGFSTATGSSATISDVSANSINTNSLNTVTGVASNVTATTVNAGSGVFNSLSSSTASGQSGAAQTGNVRDASGNGIAAQNFTGNQTNVSNLTSQTSNVGTASSTNLAVAGVLSGNNGNSNVSSSTNLNATTVNSDNYTSDNTSVQTANITGNTVLTGRLVANTTLNTSEVYADVAEIGGVNVGGNASVGGAASAQNFVIAGNLQTGSVTAQSGSFSDLTGSTLNANTVNSGTFNGGSFTGSDFVTPVSSVMNNRNLITDQKNKLDNCMYVTTYCFPKPPVISSPQCPNCTQSGFLLSFTATATATISSCQHGCSYEWIVSGSASASCPSGVIPKMNSGSVVRSCTLSRSQSEGTNSTGLVTLKVYNTRRNTYQATHNFNYAFTSSTAPTPSASISCSGCSQSTQSESAVSFNSTLTANFTNCPYGCYLSWSGACSGTTGSTCYYNRTVNAGGSHNTSANVTVYSNANPSKQATGSRSISYSVGYPACASNQVRVGGVCQCPSGTTWNGSSCAVPPPVCSGGQVLVGGVCTCTGGTTWNGSSCVAAPPTCTGGQVLVGGVCTCTGGTSWNGSSCVAAPPTCTGGQVLVGGVCTCTGGTTWNGSSCVTPPTVCTGGRVLVGGVCTCPAGTTWNGSSCESTNTPVTPSISASCSGCSDTTTSATAVNYSMTITASYSSCPDGCSITWGGAPSGFSKSSCSNTTGFGSGSASCTLTTSVSPGSTRSGSISVTARNQADSTKAASDGASMSFTVNAPAAASCTGFSQSIPVDGSKPNLFHTITVPNRSSGQWYSFVKGNNPDFGRCSGVSYQVTYYTSCTNGTWSTPSYTASCNF